MPEWRTERGEWPLGSTVGATLKPETSLRQGDQILVSRKASDETAFPRTIWRVRVVEVVGR